MNGHLWQVMSMVKKKSTGERGFYFCCEYTQWLTLIKQSVIFNLHFILIFFSWTLINVWWWDWFLFCMAISDTINSPHSSYPIFFVICLCLPSLSIFPCTGPTLSLSFSLLHYSCLLEFPYRPKKWMLQVLRTFHE